MHASQAPRSCWPCSTVNAQPLEHVTCKACTLQQLSHLTRCNGLSDSCLPVLQLGGQLCCPTQGPECHSPSSCQKQGQWSTAGLGAGLDSAGSTRCNYCLLWHACQHTADSLCMQYVLDHGLCIRAAASWQTSFDGADLEPCFDHANQVAL